MTTTSNVETKKKKKRPKTGGRKLGTPNKKSAVFRERLESHGCDIDQALAKAILARDYEMIKALQTLLGYFVPKLRDIEPTQHPASPPAPDPTVQASTESLLALVKG